MIVRAVEVAEWEALRALRLRALETDPRAFGRTAAEERAMSEREWQERLARPDSRTLVAERDGTFVGMTGVTVEEGEAGKMAFLWGMWVAPEARGAGAGRALIEAALEVARGWGLPRAVLWVNVEMREAARLYERCGFARAGEPMRGTRDPSRVFQRMERALEPSTSG